MIETLPRLVSERPVPAPAPDPAPLLEQLSTRQEITSRGPDWILGRSNATRTPSTGSYSLTAINDAPAGERSAAHGHRGPARGEHRPIGGEHCAARASPRAGSSAGPDLFEFHASS